MVGSSLYRRLHERFGGEAVHRAPVRDLLQVRGVGPLTAKAILEAPDAAPELELAERHGIEVIPLTDRRYPAALRGVYDHPLVLYRRGATAEADGLAVGIVGSRGCTAGGRRQAERFGRELAGLGITVVSGLARGIDTAAHRGALAAPEGRTLAVLGHGLLRVYPPENAGLLGEICDRGAALSEFPLRSHPEAGHFPRRNRVISGLSLGVLVVEAGERSGALLTADWALEQNREVFCLPGSIENPVARGTNRLIQQGARLVGDPADLVEEIPAFAGLLEPRLHLTPLERAVWRQLGPVPRPAESVTLGTRLPAAAVERALAGLESKGAARRDPGGYVRTGTRSGTYSSSRAHSARSVDSPPSRTTTTSDAAFPGTSP